MKKLFLILGGLIVLLIAAIVLIPILFKDDIQKALDKVMAESLDATVYYDIDNFSLSLIRNFPDLTVSLSDFGIVGKGIFEEDTLTSVNNFEVTVDVMSVINGEQIMVEKILLEEPKIMIMVLPDGTANYDIAKASEEVPEEEGEQPASDVSIGIKQWKITNAKLAYLDQSMDFYTTLMGLNHEGSGDFTLDVFDMTTLTTVDAASLGMEGVEYVTDKKLMADVTLLMDLSKMSFAFKENTIAINDFQVFADGTLSMPGEDILMDIEVGSKAIDLKSILSLIPGAYRKEYLAGVSAGGEVSFNGLIKGTYNESSMPHVSANLAVSNGRVAYSEFDIPIEAIEIQAGFDYPSADLSQTSLNVDRFSMQVDGEQLSAFLKVKNLVNYHWDFGFEGSADLEKITKVVPLEDMTLLGKINAALMSKGKFSDVESEQYDQLETMGSLSIRDFVFESTDLPHPFGISNAQLSFDPSAITLDAFDASSGSSDFRMKGKVMNYLGYAMSDKELLEGELNFSSDLIAIDELLPEVEEEPEEEISDTLSVVRIPENVYFTLNSTINKITYSDLTLSNFTGRVLVKDGSIILDENKFNLLDGTFELAGSYVTKDLEKPSYDLSFKIKDLSIASAFSSFETVQKYVPIAEQVTGKFSSDFKVNGLLGEDMMPLTDEIDLSGLVNIAQATLDKGKFMQKLSSFTALKSGANGAQSDKINLRDVLVKTEIKDGTMYVEPFELEVKGQKAVLGGNNTLDGQLNYSMLLKDVPTGAVGKTLNSALSSLTGGKELISENINLNLGIGGTYDDPTLKLLGSSDGSGSSVTQSYKKQLSSEVEAQKAKAKAVYEKQKAEVKAKAKAAEDSARAVLEARKQAAEDSVKAAVDAKRQEAEEKAKNKLKGLFKKGGGE